MIIYQSTRKDFLEDCERHAIETLIENAYMERTGRYVSPGEYRAWQNSLTRMADVLYDDALPEDMGVGIEFGIPQTSKRIDFLLSGEGKDGESKLIIIELKQWSTSRISEKDGVIVAQRGGHAEREGAHPCYQAWSYASLLENFNEAIHEHGVGLKPCAYLHNYQRDGVIDAPPLRGVDRTRAAVPAWPQ